jgi:hypothetical protein
MPFITFIYRLPDTDKVFYGKCVMDYISDDHEGLDKEVRGQLLHGLNMLNLYPINSDRSVFMSKIKVGVISFALDEHVPSYSSDKEISCFDFYYKQENGKHKYYVDGARIK